MAYNPAFGRMVVEGSLGSMFKEIRAGQQEKRASRLSDLQYRLAEGKMAEFEKGSTLRGLERTEAERKLQPGYVKAQEASAAEVADVELEKMRTAIKKDKATIEKIEKQVSKLESEADLKKEQEGNMRAVNIIDEIFNTNKGNPAAMRQALEKAKDSILEHGSDGTDDAFLRAMELPDNELAMTASTIRKAAIVTMEMEQEAWGKQQEARSKAAAKPISGLKAADANSIYKQSVGFFGGTFDESGNIRTLDPLLANKVQELSNLAQVIFREASEAGNPMLHGEAVTMAIKEMKKPLMESMSPEQKAAIPELKRRFMVIKHDKDAVKQFKKKLEKHNIPIELIL